MFHRVSRSWYKWSNISSFRNKGEIAIALIKKVLTPFTQADAIKPVLISVYNMLYNIVKTLPIEWFRLQVYNEAAFV